MNENRFPPGWGEERAQRVFAYCETQTEDEAIAEVEAAYEDQTPSFVEVPFELVPTVRELIARHEKRVD